jgi:muramidase (phage lysozyme)
LETIKQSESGGDYHRGYGPIGDIADLSHHPGIHVPGPTGKPTSAFGAYQFEQATWEEMARKHNLPDMSPANQDRAAWELAKERYPGNLEADLASRDPAKLRAIANALHRTWTSLPGGTEQGQSEQTFFDRVLGYMDRQAARKAPAATPASIIRTQPKSSPGAAPATAPALEHAREIERTINQQTPAGRFLSDITERVGRLLGHLPESMQPAKPQTGGTPFEDSVSPLRDILPALRQPSAYRPDPALTGQPLAPVQHSMIDNSEHAEAHIGSITIHTQAQDAGAIARRIGAELRQSMLAPHANYGLA